MPLRYELLGCALHDHALVGADAARIEPADAPVAREDGLDGRRWLRCLRCDAWVPHDPPTTPTRDVPPRGDEIVVPLRGRALRDRFVLRLIAVDRVVHVVGLGLLGVGVLVFVSNRAEWSLTFGRLLSALQSTVGGPVGRGSRLLDEAQHAFDAPALHLQLLAAALLGYAVLEGVEAVGLWFAKRWAEYLTFVATTILLVPEIYELAHGLSPTKIIALLINVAVVVYLLLAKRLFGLRGGGRAEAAERAHDMAL